MPTASCRRVEGEEERRKLSHSPSAWVTISQATWRSSSSRVGMSVGWGLSIRQWLEAEDTPGSHSNASSVSSGSHQASSLWSPVF